LQEVMLYMAGYFISAITEVLCKVQDSFYASFKESAVFYPVVIMP